MSGITQHLGITLLKGNFESLINLLPQLIYIIDIETPRVVYVNEKIKDFLGYSPEDYNIVDEKDDKWELKQAFEKILNKFDGIPQGKEHEFIMNFRHKNGEIRTLQNKGIMFLPNEFLKKKHLILFANDITNEVLHNEISKFKQIQIQNSERSLQYGTWEFNIDSEKITWSDGMFDILEIDRKLHPNNEINKGFYLSFIPENERLSVEFEGYSKINAKVPYYEIEHSILTAKGNTKYINLRAHYFETNKTKVVLGTIVDITDKKLADKALCQQMRQLQRQHTQMQEAESIFKYGSWEFDVLQNILHFSEGMFSVLGTHPDNYKPDEINLDFYKSFVHPEDLERLDKFCTDLVEKVQDTYEIDHRIYDSMGSLKHFLLRAKQAKDENGKIIRIFGVTADISEIESYRKELEGKVVALNKSNQELEQFAYIASHDLQEPLRKIKAFGERLEKKYNVELGEEGKFFIERMLNATQRMNRLIDDLLTYSRASRQMEPSKELSLNEILKNVLEDLELKIIEQKAVIELDDLPNIEAQPVQMHQLFQNLIDNAIKFKKINTPPNIKIKTTKLNKIDYLKFPTLKSDLIYYRFSISDNGIGFDQQYASQIFNIFQRLHGRTEYDGTGLGLAICRKIIESHQGLIEATGQEGIGAEFVFYLPTHTQK